MGAWRALNAGDRVGGILFNDSEIVDLQPQRSHTQVLRLLHEVVSQNQALAESDSASRGVTLNHALEAALRRATHDHLVVLISDLDGADGETQRIATQISAHNDMLVVGIYDPLGASLQPQPGMFVEIGSERLALPVEADFPAAFRRTFARRLDEWMNIFRALRVPVMPISTAEAPADQMRDLFGRQLKPQ